MQTQPFRVSLLAGGGRALPPGALAKRAHSRDEKTEAPSGQGRAMGVPCITGETATARNGAQAHGTEELNHRDNRDNRPPFWNVM